MISSSQRRTAILLAALLPVLAFGYLMFFSKDGNFTEPVPQAEIAAQPAAAPSVNSGSSVATGVTIVPSVPSSKDSAATSPTVATAEKFKDGTYTATGTYQSPGGADALDVTLTVKNSVVTDASIVEKPGDPASKQWQDTFASGYKTQVVGKNLADLHLTNVSGSSLTPMGFDDAVNQIRSESRVV